MTTIDTTATEPPRNWFLDIASAPTEDLLRHAETLRAKLAHAQERGRRVDARAYELRLLDVERAIAVHNRRATEAEDQRAACTNVGHPEACASGCDSSDPLADLVALASAKPLTADEVRAVVRDAFLAGGQYIADNGVVSVVDLPREAAEYARSKAGG